MNTSTRLILTAVVSAVLGAAAYALYMRPSSTSDAGMSATAGDAATPGESERKVLYWYDPMVPQSHFDKPGKSPFMDMDLVPKYADGAGTADGVRIDPRVTQNMGVRLAEVEQVALDDTISAPGTVRADDKRVVVVQSRVTGYIESQPVRELNQTVRRGQVLLTLTAPDTIAAQHELLLALRGDDAPLAAAARERLALLGLSRQQIDGVARSAKVVERVPIAAPVSGIVSELNARLGQTVMAGAPLATLTDLSRVWVIADVPERDAASVAADSRAQISFAALPGRRVDGKVDYVYPDVAGSTRTLQVRIPVANPDGEFKPGMLASVRFSSGVPAKRLLVPSAAVIETGKRSVVVVAAGTGRFAVAEVKTGGERDGKTEVLSGLAAGQKVVVSGQFLIDSEASLTATINRLEAIPPAKESTAHDGAPAVSDPSHDMHMHDGAPAKDASPVLHHASGQIDSIDQAAGKLKITHGPVASMGMPGMTMNFPVERPDLLSGVKPGDKIDFEFRVDGSKWIVTRITPQK